MSGIPIIRSIAQIERQYNTGELPVLVNCSDGDAYICKYMRSSGSSFKLANELIGAMMAQQWELTSPAFAFVMIEPEHWARIFTPHSLSAPAIGYKQIKRVADINTSTYMTVKPTESILEQILKIALFDCWIANEDRTINNSNLLYNAKSEELISIDYGGILNTGSFDFPMSELTLSDSILYADIFRHIIKDIDTTLVRNKAHNLSAYYDNCIKRCASQTDIILSIIPTEWKVPTLAIQNKLEQLFAKEWVERVWENYIECINETLSYE